MSPTHVGMIEALTGAIGESDAELGGFFQTRLTAAVPTGVALVATLTWNGTTTITLTDTSELAEGDWVRLNSDGQYFQIDTIIPNTSLAILNPTGRAIPTGSSPSSKAVTTFPVETTLDWDAEGMIGIDGVRYHYTGKTDTAFEGVYFLAGGEVVPGPAKLLRVQSTVIDLNRSRSGMDLVRRAMLVEYAEGDDLNALARNLGVLRLPFISSDDKFRAILKALAYNPKGTMFGLELALTGLVGAGNFSLYEDLIRYPNTVFVRLLGSATTDDRSQGKSYLSGQEIINAVNTAAIPIAFPVKARGGVHHIYWAGEDHFTDCRLAFPSTALVREYPGAGLTPVWTFQGDSAESARVLQMPFGAGIQFGNVVGSVRGRYSRSLRAGTKSVIRLGVLGKKNTGDVDLEIQTALTVADGVRGVSAVITAFSGTLAAVGLVGAVQGPFATPAVTATISNADYHTITLEKYRNIEWRLFIDGQLISTLPYASGVSTPWTRSMFGISGSTIPGGLARFRVKQATVWASDDTDFASIQGTAGVLANPDDFATGGYVFQADDVGKSIRIEGSAVSNVAGGNNNGQWEVQPAAVGFASGPVDGPQRTGAEVPGATPTRISVPASGPQFRYPDDLGRTITISGSTLGNNGTWVIAQLLDPATLTDLDVWATKILSETNVCEVTGASLVPETGLGWQLHPDFTTETVSWQLPGAITVTGQLIALRGTFPTMDVGMLRVLAITYSQVLSAGVLPDTSATNEVTQEVPDLWFRYYPFYIADPLGFVRTYLKEITAAGVIPDFQIV